ncbi:hypothetical protein N7488_012094 [Penicillium malachiteum]|nr:hypothetical protein N7488_012094 [Penicillium malachiteum]
MSGFEIAGLALAIFPLVISGLEHYGSTVESMRSGSVDSDYEMARMINHPHDPLWKDPQLEAALRRRLPGEMEYSCYMESVETFHEALKKLETKIQPLQEKSALTSFLHKEYKRFALTLSKKRREKLLNSLEQCNGDMSRLLGNSDELQQLRHKRKTRLPRVFQQTCEQAASVHAALNTALRCKFPRSHSAKLLLFPYTDQISDQDPHDDKFEALKLNLFFPMTAGQWSNSLKPDHCPHYARYAIAAEMLVDPGESEESVKSYSPGKAPEQGSTSQGARKHSIATTRTVSFSSTLFSLDSTSTQKASNASSLQTDFLAISDICSSLRNLRTDQTSMGVLSDKDGRYHILRSVVHEELPISDSPQLVTLDSLFNNSKDNSPTPNTPAPASQFSRHQRLSIALILARALQLSPGPWLSHDWSKKDVCFLRRVNEKRSILCPYGAYLGPDGAETEFTRFNTAQKWQQQTLEDGAIDLYSITQRCIFCAFGALSQDLRDDGLRRAIYDDVVKGLEKIVSQYEDP